MREYAEYFGGHISETRENLPAQAYAIMTLCRALYTICTGEQVSKQKAANWVSDTYPEETEIIADAFVWRTNVRPLQDGGPLYHPLAM